MCVIDFTFENFFIENFELSTQLGILRYVILIVSSAALYSYCQIQGVQWSAKCQRRVARIFLNFWWPVDNFVKVLVELRKECECEASNVFSQSFSKSLKS